MSTLYIEFDEYIYTLMFIVDPTGRALKGQGSHGSPNYYYFFKLHIYIYIYIYKEFCNKEKMYYRKIIAT